MVRACHPNSQTAQPSYPIPARGDSGTLYLAEPDGYFDNTMNERNHESRLDISDWSREWSFPDGVTYLNHGSFGPSPQCVREARHAWCEKLEQQPMDFFLRQMEPALDAARIARLTRRSRRLQVRFSTTSRCQAPRAC